MEQNRRPARRHPCLPNVHGYGRRLVPEPDAASTAHEPRVRCGPMLSSTRSIAGSRNSAQTTQEVY
jgi:hypothetical protein